jgi:hypothetical protein
VAVVLRDPTLILRDPTLILRDPTLVDIGPRLPDGPQRLGVPERLNLGGHDLSVPSLGSRHTAPSRTEGYGTVTFRGPATAAAEVSRTQHPPGSGASTARTLGVPNPASSPVRKASFMPQTRSGALLASG